MNSGQEHDEWLMLQVAQGRHEQIEPLVRRYGTLLLSFIRHMVGDLHRSEELFQDVFLAVWVKREQYRFPRPFKPWLYRIAINRCRQAFRGRRVIEKTQGDESRGQEVTAGGPSPPESAIAVETSTMVERALTLLPPKQRMVVVMRLWNNFSYAQIAQAMGVAEGTVRSNMHDALASIRRYLEPRL